EQRKLYKRDLWTFKKGQQEALWAKLHFATKTSDSKRFWKIINTIDNGAKAGNNANITEEVWVSHLKSHLKELTIEEGPQMQSHTIGGDPNTPEPLKFTAPELLKIIGKSRMDCAPGPNGLPQALFKQDTERWANFLAAMFNDVITTGIVPASWKGSIIHPIYKGGSALSSSNYRLIALLDVDLKYFSCCVLKHLEAWITENNILPFNQTGFTKHQGTLTNLMGLGLIINRAKAKGTPTYLCFVDFKAAFDCVSRGKMWAKLLHWGLPHSILNAIKMIYSDTWVKVKLGEGSHLSRAVKTTVGVKQGCVLAPTLFNLYIADLPVKLNGHSSHSPSL
ncbi:hypothetical protein NDU88_002974, partial [Pleurodeles waltl]